MEALRGYFEDQKVKEFLDWFIAFRDPRDIWKNQRSYLFNEFGFYFLGLLTFIHSIRHGGRYKYLWWCTIIHGIVVELVAYWVPNIDNFWHAQSTVMLIGKRLPLHVMFLYPCFLYTAAVSVARLRLRKWAEPFAVGLAVVLIDIPYDIMGVRLLWWTWHDTDPNVADRHYFVPWTSYYFHAAFASSLWLIFNGTRSCCTYQNQVFKSGNFFLECLCTLLAGIFAMPMGVLQFIPVYHVLHDNFNIHTEVCVLLWLGMFAMIVYLSERSPSREARTANHGWVSELLIGLLAHYILFMVLVWTEHPENYKVTGVHETVGKCTETVPVYTPLGQVLTKRRYFCVTDYDEGYFDFHCVRKVPEAGKSWYTICGMPMLNRPEYIVVVTAFALLGLFVYIQMLVFSGKQPPSKFPSTPAKATTGKKSKAE